MSRAYYNEIDPFAAQWLRKLIKAGHVAYGDVDERSIEDVVPNDLVEYTQCHFFAGIGGWSLALRLAGWDDSRPVWTGSCPCQPFSTAGSGKGKEDQRHLYPAWDRLIAECKPPVVFGEQVAAAITKGWLDDVYQGLEQKGYAIGSAVLPACSVGTPHRRERLWFVAESQLNGSHRTPGHEAKQSSNGEDNRLLVGGSSELRVAVANTECERQSGSRSMGESMYSTESSTWQANRFVNASTRLWDDYIWHICGDGKARPVEPSIPLLAHGVSGRMVARRTGQQGGTEVQEENWYSRVGALKGFGNAIVPQVAAEFVSAYMDLIRPENGQGGE